MQCILCAIQCPFVEKKGRVWSSLIGGHLALLLSKMLKKNEKIKEGGVWSTLIGGDVALLCYCLKL